MSPATSKLWSRRMTNRVKEIPKLSPLYNANLDLPSTSFSTDCTPPLPQSCLYARTTMSSPSLYTPTEAVGILLGQSPTEAAQNTRLAIEAATAASLQASNASYCLATQSHSHHSSPCSPAVDDNHLPEVAAGEGWGAYLLRSLSHHQDDLHMEIDTAALATEVALHVLTPEYEAGRHSYPGQMRKMRLIPLSDYGWSNLDIDSTGHTVSLNQSSLSKESIGEKPIRKGRARMSQEKRKRLARRKEREAMLLGIPPKPISAPPHISHFPTMLSSHGSRSPFSWNQPHPQWPTEANKPLHPSTMELYRPASASDGLSSRGSISSVPSLGADESDSSAGVEASPNTSPESDRRIRFSFVRTSEEAVLSLDSPNMPVPRLMLQPPSPQNSRLAVARPTAAITTTTSSSESPPMMRWSTMQGHMTS